MSSYLDELIQQDYNPDGTMKSECRLRMLGNGLSEADIDEIEQIQIRNVRLEQETQLLQQQLKCEQAEMEAQWEQDYQPRQEERVRLGVVGSPVKTLDLSAMSLEERYAFEMAGLDHEELMSQGFMEPDDFYNPVEVPPMSGREDKQECYVFSASDLAADEEF